MKTTAATQVETEFAPAGRATVEELQRSEGIVESVRLFQATIDAMPGIVLILNHYRQVIACNRPACGFLGTTREIVIGRRPGELIQCVNAHSGPDGCGTARECMTCGAVQAILASQREQVPDTQECRVQIENTQGCGALDLEVTATPLTADGERLTICFIKDISRTKRLQVLTRFFFHDVLNTAGGIQGFAEMVASEASSSTDKRSDLARLSSLAGQLVEEIQSQRDLTFAESGELVTRLESVETASFLECIRTLYEAHRVARDRRIVMRSSPKRTITTDRTLLARVVGNMLKNALEATPAGGEVEIRCSEDGSSMTFGVRNDGVMPEHVQLQVFQRSFSTKAHAGRGIGTHSMKLLGENYLGGKVSFISDASAGTVFSITLPTKPASESSESSLPPVTKSFPPSTSPHPTLRGRVLLAEDGPDNQRLIRFILQKAGLEIELATNGQIACEKALAADSNGKPFDLILMDIQMPVLDGHGATRRLRDSGWQRPIIALSAHATKADHQRCLDAGCTDCAIKPIDRSTLLAMVAQYLPVPEKPVTDATER